MQERLNELINTLSSYDSKLSALAGRMMNAGNGIYPVDLFATGVINRSMSLIDGFIVLIKSDNFIAAAHLARPHLDNFLRFFALWHVDDPHEIATKILKGEQLRKLRDKNGQKLSDKHLVEIATIEHPWIENVYNTTSGFIHFSEKHIFTASKLADDQSKVSLYFNKKDKFVPIESRIEAIECMIEISKCITNLLKGWIETKEIRG